VTAFFIAPPTISTIASRQQSYNHPLIVANSVTDESANEVTLTNPNEMRLREIQTELKERNVSYADCFDRESLVKRLIDARENHPAVVTPSQPMESSQAPDTDDVTAKDDATTITAGSEFDKEATIAELRELRVKVLKEKLSEYKVRWGTMIEKEEMVQALCNAMKQRFIQSKNFSRSGSIIPGEVTDVTESVLLEEMGWLESDVQKGVATKPTTDGDDLPHSPILLDVYATWCGPCKFVAPQLEAAAQVLGPTCRFMKLDSDKYQRLASVLRVGGLPTLVYFDGGNVSQEVKRVEGALTKDGILDFINECRTMTR
jgi:thiol-disulfide isomerase/thioredoxin